MTDPRRPRVLAGALVCGISAAVVSGLLLSASPVVLVLLVFGIGTLILSLLFDDLLDYWLAVFVLALPFNVTKLFFFSPEEVYRLREQLGLKGIENLVPLVYAFDLPLLALLAVWFVRRARERGRIEVPSVLFLAGGYLGWATLTLAVAPSKLLGITWILYQAQMLLIGLCVAHVARSPRRLRIIVGALLVGLALQAAATVYSYTFQLGEDLWGGLFGARYTQQELRPGVYRGVGGQSVYEKGALLRGTGTIGAGNEEAKYFVMTLPFALMAACLARRRAHRFGGLALLAAGMGALLLTFSRGGAICTAAALTVAVVLMARRDLIGRRTVVRLALVGATAVVAVSPMIYDFFASRPQYLGMRFDHIAAGLAVALEHPVVGVGINNFAVSISPYDYGGIFKVPVHNHYVRVWCETGLVGIALYLSFYACILAKAYRCTSAPDRFLAGLSIAALSALIGISIYWADDIFYGVLIRAHVWLLVGIILATERLAAEPASKGVRPGSEARPA